MGLQADYAPALSDKEWELPLWEDPDQKELPFEEGPQVATYEQRAALVNEMAERMIAGEISSREFDAFAGQMLPESI